MKKTFTTLAIAVLALAARAGEDYVLVSPAVATGAKVTNGVRTYVGGISAFPTIAQALAAVNENGTVTVTAGTYSENVTISTVGVKLLGAQAYCEKRSGTRSGAETIITGTIKPNANSLMINGFTFTGNGRVVNTAATTENPMKSFTFSYNIVTASTLGHEDKNAVLRLGTVYTGTNAQLAENNRHYGSVTVTNNTFTGDASHMTPFVFICGATGTQNISGNTFTDGGRSILVANSTGNTNICHNTFKNVGASKMDFDGAIGEFTIQLRYMGLTNRSTIKILNNVFDNCQGHSNGYYPVVLDQGSGTDVLVPNKNSSLTLSYNVIKGLNYTTGQTSAYNHFFWANGDNTSVWRKDFRFNRCDNSEVAFGMSNNPWDNGAQRIFSGSSGKFDFAGSQGTVADYYKCPDGQIHKDYAMATTQAVQSFDIDRQTGDIYFVQLDGEENGATAPLRVTRLLFRSDGTRGRQYMYLTNCSHGANLAVFRYDGKVWISTGGASIYDGHAKPQSIYMLPFVNGATVNCSSTTKKSFTYNGDTYPIKQFQNQWGKEGSYPAIDVENRLFCDAHKAKTGVIRYAIYDLDSVLEKGSDAPLIKALLIESGSKKYQNSDAAYADIVKKDQGYQTPNWAMQGYTIAGEYIYNHSGVGLHNAYSYSYNGAKIPTIMQDCFNWRDSTYVHRKPVLNSKVRSAANGEPEGVKIVRDATGRPHMIMSIIWTPPSTRHHTLVDFTAPSGDHVGYSYTIPTATIDAFTTPSKYSTASPDESQSKKLRVQLHKCIGQPQAVVTGPDAHCFAVDAPEASGINVWNYDFPISFKADATKKTYSATLRVSAPGAKDITVPLTASYSGTINTGVDEITTTPEAITPVAYYDLYGRILPAPAPGINIVRYSDGTTRKIRF